MPPLRAAIAGVSIDERGWLFAWVAYLPTGASAPTLSVWPTAQIGACSMDDCALTVLATVVSTSVPGQAVIDAGAKALGREPMRGSNADGFGCLLNDTNVIVASMSEEHGILDLSRSSRTLRVGERVRVVPNHVCIVVHLADVVYGLRDDAVATSWPVAARGRGQPVLADPASLMPLRTGLGR